MSQSSFHWHIVYRDHTEDFVGTWVELMNTYPDEPIAIVRGDFK